MVSKNWDNTTVRSKFGIASQKLRSIGTGWSLSWKKNKQKQNVKYEDGVDAGWLAAVRQSDVFVFVESRGDEIGATSTGRPDGIIADGILVVNR